MDALGFASYAVVGHDRGAPCAHRLAVDHGVAKLAVLDGVPIVEAPRALRRALRRSWWHWFFFAQTAKPAEDIIIRDPLALVPGGPGGDGRRELRRLARARSTNPDVVRAMVDEYRAGLERRPATTRPPTAPPAAASRCPMLVAWSVQDDLEELYGDPVAIWRPWVLGPLTGARIDSGHHMAEEAPEQLASALVDFLR